MAEDSPTHPLFAALYDPVTAVAERTVLRPHREYLVRNLTGRVLDLGAGTGAMFPYFSNSEAASLHAIEPDPHMRKQAESKASELDLEIDIGDASAESLPYGDDQFDTVVASMVFCTITDVEAALAEVHRVLKPGGEFRFLEHVHADGWRATVQNVLAPLWRRIAGGCHLNRQTISQFTATPEFDTLEIERLDVGMTPVWPFVRGRLRKRE
ncbi:class I SAM-dependent methyltransferase [Haladaptatus paucihalophilus]|uniref:Methyltransferase domain-containing protein n=2 Tax=Haladaptatus paucihalophilus DX253 TaxID=797209 RepID=A0A1M7C5P6_HALPU|nr:class I SAM-dependent methyltransferase [Haladaptatus paucihalophilus]SHL62535.1 Methyltransferase domain-containing protein [Haladaptatus paucihalophilus DX253]